MNLTFTSNPLIAYGCFSAGSAAVTGTSAAVATITVNTTSTTCTTSTQPLVKGTGTSAAAHSPVQPGNHAPGELPAGIAMAGLLAIGFAGRRSRLLRGAIAVAVLAIAGFGLAGCGGGGTATGVVGGTGGGTTTTTGTATKGTYNVTVFGEDASTGLQESTTFSLTLQ